MFKLPGHPWVASMSSNGVTAVQLSGMTPRAAAGLARIWIEEHPIE